MSAHFTHLHLHTDYSLLDGAITIEKLIEFGKSNNFKALAISDHGNIFGAVKFFKHAHKAGIKPILGMEAYLTEDITVKDAQNKYYHCILLVENAIGYKNLCKLIALSYSDGFYFKPRIDYKALALYSEGLTITTACLGGHIPQLLMNNNYEEANKKIDWYLRTFGPERFYLEVQPEDQRDQKILNEKIFDISQQRGVQVVAAGDCHYVSAADHEAHEVMLSIQTHHKITDSGRFTFGDCRVHMRTQAEMLEIFKDHPEAIWASGAIADRCNFTFETGKLYFPQFEIPTEYTQETYFEKLCQKGLAHLFEQQRIDHAKEEQYAQRLRVEIELIIKMGFVGYFLVVSDFIQWARAQKIPVGPGRGSAAGSLVAWALQITDIDPLKYNLLFERFLNPERVSMPDIDIDFCIEGRDRVIQYVRDKYGHDKVCQIITFGTMMAKGVIKDVARVLGFSFEDSNMLTDLIPEQLKITLKDALEQEQKLQELRSNSPQIAHLFDIAIRLEGLTRHASKHAAGIVISPEPISDVLPVYVPPKTHDLVTQYAMTELESLGFLKMDFLGLKNLTLIQRAVNLIHDLHGIEIDVQKISLEDPATFTLLARGITSGVFQLESEGIKDVLQRLKPTVFEDIIAVNALYRPGPLGSGMVDDFIERKHGRQEIVYLFPELEPILKETYGVIVYQEQVMKIASTIAFYTLGEADLLRRAMGKKKADEMAQQKTLFVGRAIQHNFNEKKAAELFELMAYFAGYGFNKSHSAAYALIAYQTAYLKAHYPAEFMACLISLESHDSEKMAFYIQEAQSLDIAILPPDINHSQILFSVRDNKIRFGLQGIKNVGLAALDSIIENRTQHGPFIDMLDFCSRIDLRTCNKRVLESLICSGSFDTLPGNRAQKHEDLSKIIDRALEKKKAALTGQLGLFDTNHNSKEPMQELFTFAQLAEWTDTIKLEKEHEVLGIYMSAQPLDQYKQFFSWFNIESFASSIQKKDMLVLGCGLLKNYKIITTKKGDKMAFATLEDFKSKAEIIIFPKLLTRIEHYFNDHTIYVVKGIVDTATSTVCKIKAHECMPLTQVLQNWPTISKITCRLPEYFDEASIKTLKTMFIAGKIPLEIVFQERDKLYKIATRSKITIDADQLIQLHKLNIDIKVYL
ncbi:MAG: DNA polymerase III subunit alpha [Candidatus Babeliaceae bacterium]|jgi:DNA polymerase-3 subunit alpha